MVDDLYDVTDDGVVLSVHAQPGAGRTQIIGRHGDALKVRVAAPPEHGRANDALVEVLAEEFGVAASKVELVAGEKSRTQAVPARRGRPRGLRPHASATWSTPAAAAGRPTGRAASSS